MGLPGSGPLSPGCFVWLCRMCPAQKHPPLVVSEGWKLDPAPTAPKQRTPEQGSMHVQELPLSLYFTRLIWVSWCMTISRAWSYFLLGTRYLAILCLSSSCNQGNIQVGFKSTWGKVMKNASHMISPPLNLLNLTSNYSGSQVKMQIPKALSPEIVLVSLSWDPGITSLTSILCDLDAGEVRTTLVETWYKIVHCLMLLIAQKSRAIEGYHVPGVLHILFHSWYNSMTIRMLLPDFPDRRVKKRIRLKPHIYHVPG